MSVDFDSVDQGVKRNDEPIWKLLKDKKPDDTILSWCNGEVKFLQQENEDRIREIKHNVARYKGIQYTSQDTRSSNRDKDIERAKFNPKIVINLLQFVTEMRVSRLVKYRPAVQILPTNDEHQDKVSSKIAKNVDDHIAYTQRFESKVQNVVRVKEITGEGYLDTLWNPDLGDIHPDQRDLKDGERLPLLDKDGKQVERDGEKQWIKDSVKVGDVEHKIILPHQLLMEKADAYEDADYAIKIEPINTEKLKEEYPDKKDEIKADNEKSFFSFAKLEDEKLNNKTLKYTLIHKKTKHLPQGAWIVFTKDVLLENSKHKYDHGDFTWDRLPGIEVPGEQHAISIYTNLKGPAAQYNNLTSMAARHIALAAHPKWFVPRGSVKLETLGNDIAIAQYQGTQAPILAQGNPVSAQVFEFRDKMKVEVMEQGRVGDTMRGEPPSGIKAGVALQFLAEQESQMQNADVANYNEFIKRVTKKRLSVAAQFYDEGDKRTMLVLGRNKNWVAQNYDPSALARSYDIREQNSSALPESKAARTQFLLDIAERFPNAVPEAQLAEMLDLGLADKFLDELASASRAAEYENELLLDGKKVAAPELYEDQLTHWKLHVKQIQDPSFKRMPDKIKQSTKDHIAAHEMFMVELSKSSPAFGQQLLAIPQFPLFFVPQAQAVAGSEAPVVGVDQGAIPDPNAPPDQLPPDAFAPGEEIVPTGEMMPPMPQGEM